MSTEIQVSRPSELPAEDTSVGAVLRLAIERGVDVDVLERLVALRERVDERNAEAAMVAALVGFQADCPPVPRTRTAEVKKNGVKQYEYRFAPFEKIVSVIRSHLMNHGLSYTHDSVVGEGRIRVTCVLQHVDGARRSSTFEAPFDNSGGKNPLQAVGSARSYGKRYTLCDVLGLTTDEDDDGRAGGGEPGDDPPESISEKQAADLDDLIEAVGANREKVLRFAKVERIADMAPEAYAQIVRELEARRAG